MSSRYLASFFRKYQPLAIFTRNLHCNTSKSIRLLHRNDFSSKAFSSTVTGMASSTAMKADGINYNISFPKGPIDSSTRVVLMLGWAGSTRRHLDKYAAIYSSQNCVVISYTHPVATVYLTHPNSRWHLKASEKIAGLLEKHDLETNPVLIHVFSNGGFSVYQQLAEVVEKRDVHVLGTVFDSSPAKNSYMMGYSALVDLPMFRNPVLKGLGVTLYTLLYAKATFQHYSGLQELNKGFRVISESPDQRWPHLFLHSAVDKVAPPCGVAEMAEKRRSSGAPLVRVHDFGDSPHVQHFRHYPEEYTKYVEDFFAECVDYSKSRNVPASGENPAVVAAS